MEWGVRRAVAVAVGAVWLLLGSSAWADTPVWGPPTDLTAMDGPWRTGPSVAMNASGQAVVAWERDDSSSRSHIEATARDTGAGFPPATILPATDVRPPVTAIDPAGNSFVLFAQAGDRMAITTRAPGGTFGPPKPLGNQAYNAMCPAIGVDDRGNATAFWTEMRPTAPGSSTYDYVGFAAYRPSGGDFGAPQTIPIGGCAAYAVAGNGDAVAVTTGGTRPNATISVSTRNGNGSFGAPVTIDSGQAEVSSPVVSMDPRGDAVVAWADCLNSRCECTWGYYNQGCTPGAGNDVAEIRAVVRSAGGSFGAPQRVATFVAVGSVNDAPLHMAVDRDGNAVIAAAATLSDESMSGNLAWYRPWGSTFGATEMISQNGALQQVADDDAGNTYAIMGPPGHAQGATDTILIAVRPVGARFSGSVTTLQSTSNFLGDPLLATGPAGDALAVWMYSGNQNCCDLTTIQTAESRDPAASATSGSQQAPTTDQRSTAELTSGASPGNDASLTPSRPAGLASRSISAAGVAADGSHAKCRVPRLRGFTVRAARGALHAAGLLPPVVRRARAKRGAFGRVITSNPAAGTALPCARAVQITISEPPRGNRLSPSRPRRRRSIGHS